MYVKKAEKVHQPQAPDSGVLEGGLMAELPAVAEYLSAVRWEDESPRETSTLLLFREEGQWRVCLNDRANQRAAFASGASLEAAVGALERALQEDRVEWRKSRPWKGGGRPK